MSLFKLYNGPFPTTSIMAGVTTGTSLKTMLQVKSVGDIRYKVKAWGVSMDGSAAAAGVQWELIETGTVFGTVTAHVAGDIAEWDGQSLGVTKSALLSLGTSATGYTCTSEGSVTASRLFDHQFIQPSGQYAWEFSLGNEPVCYAANALRIRCKAAAAVNAVCWMILEF